MIRRGNRRGLLALAVAGIALLATTAVAEDALQSTIAPAAAGAVAESRLQAEEPRQAGDGSKPVIVEMRQQQEGQTPGENENQAAVPPLMPPSEKSEEAVKEAATPAVPPAVGEQGSPAPQAAPGDENVETTMIPALVKRANPRRPRPSSSGLSPYEDREPWGKQKHDEEEEKEKKEYAKEAKAEEERETKRKQAMEDYYGLNTEPAFHLDTQAFQPSHILEFTIAAGTTESLYEDVLSPQVGTVMRGDYYVTTGDDTLSIAVTISGPDGSILYKKGPRNEDYKEPETEEEAIRMDRELNSEWITEGSFRFIVPRAGTYRIDITNPSQAYERTVAFAFLLGKDNDDSFAPDFDPNGVGGIVDEDGSGIPGVGVPKQATVQEAMDALKKQTSKVHQKLDEVVAMSSYADVRFKRHLQTVMSTNDRMLKYTLAETAVIILSVFFSIVFVSRLNLKSPYASVYGGGGAGREHGPGSGRVKYGLV
jgi:emp24/gp25L/p24 family/GOLD